MKQFEDLTDYTFQTPDGKEITVSADDFDSALDNVPQNSELIRVNDDPRF
tara:strand:+ start:1811 stop:1960 length:150 start_codon:yes stop_codon:yes gene_type:complete